MAFLKLTTLVIKTLSKPLSKALKTRVTADPKMAQFVEAIGQKSHSFWSSITIRAAGHKGLRVKPLDEATALNQGADIMAEFFIFSVASGAMVLELVHSNSVKARESKLKKEREAAEDDALRASLESIEERISQLERAQTDLLGTLKESSAAARRDSDQQKKGETRSSFFRWGLG